MVNVLPPATWLYYETTGTSFIFSWNSLFPNACRDVKMPQAFILSPDSVITLQSCVEMALWDLLGKRDGKSLRELWEACAKG